MWLEKEDQIRDGWKRVETGVEDDREDLTRRGNKGNQFRVGRKYRGGLKMKEVSELGSFLSVQR